MITLTIIMMCQCAESAESPKLRLSFSNLLIILISDLDSSRANCQPRAALSRTGAAAAARGAAGALASP